MSASLAMSGTFARIFSFEASKKWIMREGLTGISRGGSGASIAKGWKKSRGFLIRLLSGGRGAGLPEPYKSKYADQRQTGRRRRGRAGPGDVRVALRAARTHTPSLGPGPGPRGDCGGGC